jgi:hypothetical protein
MSVNSTHNLSMRREIKGSVGSLSHTSSSFSTVNAEINLPFIFADHNDRGARVVGRVAANPAGPDGRMRHTKCLEMWLKRQVDRNDASNDEGGRK